MAKMKFDVDASDISRVKKNLQNSCKKSELLLANEILKDTRPFVPALTMSLNQKSHVEQSRANGAQIVYPGPYARYLYYGKVMEGPKYGPKVATNKNLVFTKEKHANAQAFWMEASKAKNAEKWERVGAKAIRRYMDTEKTK